MAPYFHKATGCEIEDIDGEIYIDMSTMGVGTNILGYCNTLVDSEVKRIIELGNMSSLNCQGGPSCREVSRTTSMVRYGSLCTHRRRGECNGYSVRGQQLDTKRLPSVVITDGTTQLTLQAT